MKERVDALIRNEEKQRLRDAQPSEIEKFCALCPDFDNTDTPDNRNGNGIVLDMKLHGKDHTTANAQDFRESWERIKAAFPHHVKLKKEHIRQQQQRAAKEIQEREAFDESEAYAMPLNQLRDRAAGIR